MPGMNLPVRSVFIPLSKANILISPGSRLTEGELASLGRVDEIVANNGFHNAGVPKASAIFPKARAWGVPGSKQPNILNETTWPYADELPVVVLEGIPGVNEAVFFHRESRSLVVADLCFNLVNARGFGAWLVLTLFGTYRRFGVSRFFLKYVKDRNAFQKSLKRIFEWDFDSIVMAHGEIVRSDGKDRLRAALKERGIEY